MLFWTKLIAKLVSGVFPSWKSNFICQGVFLVYLK